MPIQTSTITTEQDGNLSLDPAGTGQVVLTDLALGSETPLSTDGSGRVTKLNISQLAPLPGGTTAEDLIMVQRDDTQYKTDASEIGGVPSANPFPSDVTAVPPFESGTGTATDPFVCTPVVVNAPGGSASTVQLITISNQSPFAIGVWNDESEPNTGIRFNQPSARFGSTGVWTGRLEYVDSPDSTSGTVFSGLLGMGSDSIHISWQVTQVANQTVFSPAVSPTASPADVNYAFDNKYGTVSASYADAPGALTATGAALFKINNGATSTSGSISVGQTLDVLFDAAIVDAAAQDSTVVGTITGQSGFLLAPSIIVNRNADPFTPLPRISQPPSTVINGGNVPVAGINCKTFVTLGTSTLTTVQAAINGAAYALIPTSGTTMPINPGDTLQIRGTTGATISTSYSAQIKIGETIGTWTVTTSAATPDVAQPIITNPVDGSTGIIPDVNLLSSPYDALNGAAAHASSDWQVYEADGGDLSTGIISGISTNASDQTVLALADNTALGQFAPGTQVVQSSGGAPETSATANITNTSGGWNIGSGVGTYWSAYNAVTGLFVMGGSTGQTPLIGTSTDGKTFFSAVSAPPLPQYAGTLNSLAISDSGIGVGILSNWSTFDFFGPYTYMISFDSGVNWETSENQLEKVEYVIYGNGTFVVTSKSGRNIIHYSTNGINWDQVTVVIDHKYNPKFVGGRFFIGTDDGFYQSLNGSQWSFVNLGTAINGLATDGNGVWVASCKDRGSVFVSTNDQGNWTESVICQPSLNDVEFGNGAFCVAVKDPTRNVPFYVTFDPTKLWSPVNLSASAIDTQINRLIFGEGIFLGISTSGTSPVWSTTGGLDEALLAFNNNTNLANFRVGDVVTQTAGSATGQIAAIGATSMTLYTSDTFANAATVTGPTFPAATGVVSLTNTGNNTMVLSETEGRFLVTESGYDPTRKLDKTVTAPGLVGDGPGAPTTEPPDSNVYTAVVNSVSDTTNLTSYPLTGTELEKDKVYYSRVRYRSNDGTPVVSSYSEYNEFQTENSFVPQIGEEYGGGYFGGQILVFAGQDGGGLPATDTIYNLIVAPLLDSGNVLKGQYGGGATGNSFKLATKNVTSAPSPTGSLNEVYGGESGFTPANWTTTFAPLNWVATETTGPNAGTVDTTNAAGTGIGGFNDWYLPAKNEAMILYRSLKPDTGSNSTSYGLNPNAVPPVGYYTSDNPAQTLAPAFQTGGGEAFILDKYLTSTCDSSSSPKNTAQTWTNGSLQTQGMTSTGYIRAVRREVAI